VEEGTTLYKYGRYEVVLGDNEYLIINLDTGVVEESTPHLFEAIMIAKIHDQRLSEAFDFEPKPFANNGNTGGDTSGTPNNNKKLN